MSKNTMTSTREKNLPFEYENAYEEWSTAGIGNTFLFGKVMTSNPNLLLELLQYSLPEFHIKQIENPEKEADVKLSMDAHGVRLDDAALMLKCRCVMRRISHAACAIMRVR